MQKKKPAPGRRTKQEPEKNPRPMRIFKNIVAAGAVAACIAGCLNVQQGYSWAYNSLLKGNMQTIRTYPNLTIDQKYEMKHGTDYSYLRFLKQATPEDAVILYPSGEDFYPAGVDSPFKQAGISGRNWALRFLYPRRIVLPSEMETSLYADSITHVAIVNGRGYERLNYPVATKEDFTVLPFNP